MVRSTDTTKLRLKCLSMWMPENQKQLTKVVPSFFRRNKKMHENVTIISTEMNFPLYSDLVLVAFCVKYAVI